MTALLNLVTVGVIAICIFSIVFAHTQLKIRGRRLVWLVAIALTTALGCAVYFIDPAQQPTDTLNRGFFTILSFIGLIAAYGGLIIEDITAPDKRRWRLRLWLGAHALWAIGLLISGAVSSPPLVGRSQWMIDAFNTLDASIVITSIGFLVSSFVLLVYTLWVFYRSRIPEIANRTLYWWVTASLMLFGVFVTASGTTEVVVIAMPLIALTVIGTVYAQGHHHLFDVWRSILQTVRISLFIITGAILATLVMLTATEIETEDNLERIVSVGILGFFIAVLYIPLRQLTDLIISRLTHQRSANTAQITREYSQLIAEVIELEMLIPSATATLNELLEIRDSAIVLLNKTSDESISLLVMHPNAPTDRMTGHLQVSGILYKYMAKERQALSQFDIEFDPRFEQIDENERDFFRRLSMSAYAPITLDYTLIGILAVGTKQNDSAYYPRDLELLETLAQQTGVALRNARLVEDLQHLNKNMRTLNDKLKATNDQLSKMDSVKSDFVTIASHELRTPLAQIRGYTDILDALNEQGMLDKDQTNNLIGNLRKATERVEELISAMLDVSQLDVDAMDLRFAQSSVESLVRMAIEPLTDAIRQRKLTLAARGLRGLPSIQADLQRLVQAFRNVIVNAIKFTPDGGKIEISATVQEAQAEGDVDHILIQLTDTGVGIDRGNLEMIFKKFFRAYDPSLHSTGAYKFLGAGPGLGLTIARGVIEGHGGKIWAESSGHDVEHCPGSTFNILLPITTPEDAKRILSFEGTAANEAIGRTDDMQRNTAMRRPDEATPETTQEESA
jgi:signal transduction histidine kinase/MFS family permease